MTEEQKNTITAMRHDQYSYTAIANRLSLSVNTIKAFCRRNALDSRQLTNDERIRDLSETMLSDGLILSRNRGNTADTTAQKRPGYTSKPRMLVDYGVTVSYADEPDESAVMDVLRILMNTNYKG